MFLFLLRKFLKENSQKMLKNTWPCCNVEMHLSRSTLPRPWQSSWVEIKPWLFGDHKFLGLGRGAATDLEIQSNQKWNHSIDRKTRKQPTNQPPPTLGVANICKPRACVTLICRPGKGHRRFYSCISIGLARLYKAGFTAHCIVDLFLTQPV